jgi:prophage regulatory protein
MQFNPIFGAALMTKKTQAPVAAPADRLLPMPKVMDLTSLSKATVYRKVADGSFPAPFKIGKSRVAWLEADITGWIKSRTRAVHPEQPVTQQAA